MKSYTYTGNCNLVFSFGDKDYLVSGTGPHELPEDASIVKRHISKTTLVEFTDNQPAADDKQKVKTA